MSFSPGKLRAEDEGPVLEPIADDLGTEPVGSSLQSFRIVDGKKGIVVLAVYAFTARFPKSETYGLSWQMRRAAVSIPANIAEGFRRRGKADKVRFLNTSEASLEESRYYLILSQDLGYGETVTLLNSLEEVSRLLNSYSKAILDSSSGS